jgi:DNA (cytosine-5)-methyltransferase 1
MARPLLLDLFCGEGGASSGYQAAGFEVIGADSNIRCGKWYPFQFEHLDWQEALERYGSQADLIHASPPCQRYSKCGFVKDQDGKPDLLEPVREALKATGKPYVIENVPGAPLRSPVELCGCMFQRTIYVQGKRFALYRPRLFELGFPPPARPVHQPHVFTALPIFGQAYPYFIFIQYGISVPGTKRCELMGCGWMSQAGVAEAIPPCFTQWIAERFLEASQVLEHPRPAPRQRLQPGQASLFPETLLAPTAW